MRQPISKPNQGFNHDVDANPKESILATEESHSQMLPDIGIIILELLL
jgi:hypothetical protein